MSRRRYAFTEARTRKFLAAGRGQGFGANYKPWLCIQDLPSTGRSHRPSGIKTHRVHHLLSDGEWKCFLQFEAAVDVEDIREQFPMDRLATMNAAMELGVVHPITLDGTPFVMTIDFLVTRRVGDFLRLEPYTFKYEPDTLDMRGKELLAIAALFWRKRGYHLTLLDETSFNDTFILNYDTVRGFHDISTHSFYRHTEVVEISRALRLAIATSLDTTLKAACQHIAGAFHTEPKVVFSIAMHLIARQTVLVDLRHPDALAERPLSAFRVAH